MCVCVRECVYVYVSVYAQGLLHSQRAHKELSSTMLYMLWTLHLGQGLYKAKAQNNN